MWGIRKRIQFLLLHSWIFPQQRVPSLIFAGHMTSQNETFSRQKFLSGQHSTIDDVKG